MSDKRRFELFARLLAERFAGAARVFDVAGGQGRLNLALTALGREVTTFDRKPPKLPVRYAQRLFTLDEPCACDLVVGLHADGATRIIIEYAARHGVPFAVVPCCSDNGMSYRPWVRHLDELARARGFTVEERELPMEGRARVLLGTPGAR
jgi:hypothetical protein